MPIFAYVANDSNKISVIDTATNTVVSTIPILSYEDLTKFIAITPDGSFGYVTNLSNVVAVIDTCTNTVVDTVTSGTFPVGVSATPNGKYVYVVNSGLATSSSGTVSCIDTSTNEVVATITVGRNPVGIAISPKCNFAYVTNSKSDNVSVIDTTTNTVVTSVSVGDFPQGIAVTPNGNFAYVANQGQSAISNTVSVINLTTNTLEHTIIVGGAPSNVAITPDGNFAYVTNTYSNTVSVIDTNTNTVVNTISVGNCPFGIAITPDGAFAYVTNYCTNNISVIDIPTNTVVNTIPNLKFPLGITIANVNFPCPAPINKMCIETTRIFDSKRFKDEIKKTFKLPTLINPQHIECDIVDTQCNILSITTIDKQKDLVNVKLQIKLFVKFTSECSSDNLFRKVVCFEKNVALIKPDAANIACYVNTATCSCTQSCEFEMEGCNKTLCCTIKVTTTVKSKELVQVEVPVLRYCEPS